MAVVVVAALPTVITTPYFLHILVLTGMYVALALSYDLSVGQVGVLSLAHPAFFGIGAYTAAILAVDHGAPALATFAAGGVLAALFAVGIGVPSFRLSEHSFAIGTLGFALIAELVARNWIDLTRGPMGIPGIPRPVLGLPLIGSVRVASLVGFYYLMAVLVALAVAFYQLLVSSRVGRAFRAVREDEVLAAAAGIDARKYKMIAFAVGAAMAGILGVFYAYWFTLVSPEQFGLYYTINLLIIVFLGGRGSLRGVILGAVVFTALPEFLRITPQFRLILYGLVMLVATVYFPEGLEGVLRRFARQRPPGEPVGAQ